VRRFIKTGIGFLFAGLFLGAVILVRRELFGVWPHPHLVSAHTHAVLVGFVMFLILGVALWLFAVYFWTMWSQIRPVASQLREAKGEKF
jgi:hypothetical protein